MRVEQNPNMHKLSDYIIGTVNAQSGTISLGECSDKQRLYYMAMLIDAANKGYDCTLIHSGSDVIRKLSSKRK